MKNDIGTVRATPGKGLEILTRIERPGGETWESFIDYVYKTNVIRVDVGDGLENYTLQELITLNASLKKGATLMVGG